MSRATDSDILFPDRTLDAPPRANPMTAFDDLITGMAQSRAWGLMGEGERVRALLDRVYNERCHGARHHRDAY